jgi:hypothetical protein
MKPKQKFIEKAARDDYCCPFCGSGDVEFSGEFETDTGIASAEVSCNDCKGTWHNEYKMVGISWWDADRKQRAYSDETEEVPAPPPAPEHRITPAPAVLVADLVDRLIQEKITSEKLRDRIERLKQEFGSTGLDERAKLLKQEEVEAGVFNDLVRTLTDFIS